MTSLIYLGQGKASIFGGPADWGVGPDEGLALVNPIDLGSPWFARCFLPQQPTGTTGLARRLSTSAFYLAMRWDYAKFGKDELRRSLVRVTGAKTNLTTFAQPVDFGPGDGTLIDGRPTPDTGRIADLSPAAMLAIGQQTDDEVICELLLPEVEA